MVVEYILCRCIGMSPRQKVSLSTGKLDMRRFLSILINKSSFICKNTILILLSAFRTQAYILYLNYKQNCHYCGQVTRDYRASECYLDQEAIVFHGPSLPPGNQTIEFGPLPLEYHFCLKHPEAWKPMQYFEILHIT